MSEKEIFQDAFGIKISEIKRTFLRTVLITKANYSKTLKRTKNKILIGWDGDSYIYLKEKQDTSLFISGTMSGYKQLIATLGSDAPAYLYEILKNTIEFHRSSYESVQVKLISDSILIWSKEMSAVHFWNVVNVVDLVRLSFFKKKLLLRGGIAEGLNFIDQDIIISPALIKAYNLEREAEMPRILICEAAIAIATKEIAQDTIGQPYIQLEGFARRIHLDQIKNDFDGKKVLRVFSESNGTFFIKTGLPIWFTPADAPITEEQKVAMQSKGLSDLQSTRKLLQEMQPITTDVKIMNKYKYVIGKFNEWLSEFGDLGENLKIL